MALNKQSFYRFELVKKTGFVVDVFNLVIAPYTLGYDGRYRDNVQKTFGGTHLDLAGMDNEVIKLSGTVGGRKKRRGWAKLARKEMDNVEAIKYFRDNIWKYPDNPRYKRYWKELNIKFYDLDLDEMRWVHIDNVSITRDKAQPFWYNFSIQLIDIGEPKREGPKTRLDAALKAYKKTLDGVVDAVEKVADKINTTLAIIDAYLDTALGFTDTTVAAFVDVTDIISETVNLILTTPGRIMDRIGETITNLTNAADSINSLINTEYSLLTHEYGRYLISNLDELVQDTRLMVKSFRAIALQSDMDVVKVGTLDKATTPSTSASSEIQIDSAEEYVVKEGDTLESIALELYGDTTYSDVIAAYNNLDSAFIQAGTILMIPVYKEQSVIEGNLVISEDNNEYGIDIKLDDNGNYVIGSTGDFVTVTGPDNILQAINHILKIDIGTMISDGSFGKDDMIGSGGTRNNLKLAGLKFREALKKDPRIADVSEYSYKVDADKVFITGMVELHGKLKSLPFTLPVELE